MDNVRQRGVCMRRGHGKGRGVGGGVTCAVRMGAKGEQGGDKGWGGNEKRVVGKDPMSVLLITDTDSC